MTAPIYIPALRALAVLLLLALCGCGSAPHAKRHVDPAAVELSRTTVEPRAASLPAGWHDLPSLWCMGCILDRENPGTHPLPHVFDYDGPPPPPSATL